MPKESISYPDFSGGINESNEPDRIQRGEFQTALDVDLTLGNIQRRGGWSPIHNRVPPFFPSTREAHILIPGEFGIGIGNQWQLDFLVTIERELEDGEKYAVLCRTTQNGGTDALAGAGGSGHEVFLLYMYWLDDVSSATGGLYLCYSSETSYNNAKFNFPSGGWPNGTRVVTKAQVTAALPTFLVSIRKLVNGANRDLAVYVNDTLTATIASVGTDDLEDQLDTTGPWELGWSQLDYELGTSGLESSALTKLAPMTFGEIRLFLTASQITGFSTHEIPSDQWTNLYYHIPLSEPNDGFYPGRDLQIAGVHAVPAMHAIGSPFIANIDAFGLDQSGGDFRPYGTAGYAFNGAGSRGRLKADPDWATGTLLGDSTGFDTEFFIEIRGLCWGPCTLLEIPINDDDIFFGIRFSSQASSSPGGPTVVPELFWWDASGQRTAVEAATVDCFVTIGRPFSLRVYYFEPTATLRFEVIEKDQTGAETYRTSGNIAGVISFDDTGDTLEVLSDYRVGGSTRLYDRFSIPITYSANSDYNRRNGPVYIDRVMIRYGAVQFSTSGDSRDILPTGEDIDTSDLLWKEFDVIIQSPEIWARNQQAPDTVPVQRGVVPPLDAGERAVTLTMRFRPYQSSESYVSSHVQKTISISGFVPLKSPKILWAGTFRLRSSITSELSMILVAGGFYAIASDGTVTSIGRDIGLESGSLPDVIPAQGFLFIQGRGNRDTFLFDGQFTYKTPPPKPYNITHSYVGSGSLTGAVRYFFAFYNSASGLESGFRGLTLSAASGSIRAPSAEDITITWDKDEAEENASSMRIYRTDVGDAAGNLFLIAEVPIQDETYTDSTATLDLTNEQLLYDATPTGGIAMAYHQGRFFWSHPLFPETVLVSPALRADRIETPLIAASPARRFFSNRNALFAFLDTGVSLLTGNNALNFGFASVHSIPLPASNTSGTPVIQHASGFMIYFSSHGIEQDLVEKKQIISTKVEDTVFALDLTKVDKMSIGFDPRRVQTFFAVVSSGESEPDRMLIWSTSRTTGKSLWQIWRVPVRLISNIIQGNDQVVVFSVGGFLSTFDNPFDGWDGGSSGNDNTFTVTGGTGTRMVVSNESFADNELNGRTIYRESTGETAVVAFNIGTSIYLVQDDPLTDPFSTSPSANETFQIGRIQADFTLNQEVPMGGPRYMHVYEGLIRGAGAWTITADVDGIQATASLDMANPEDVRMFIGKSGRILQVSGVSVEDGASIEFIELWADQLEPIR